MPTVSAHIPEDWPFMRDFISRTKGRGKRSEFILELLNREFSQALSPTDAMSPTIMVELAKRLCGELTAGSLENALIGKDQRYELQRLLHTYAVEFETREIKAAGGVQVNAAILPEKKQGQSRRSNSSPESQKVG